MNQLVSDQPLCLFGQPRHISVEILGEARSHEQITPVSFGESNRAIQLVQLPFAQFQGCELKPLQLCIVDMFQER